MNKEINSIIKQLEDSEHLISMVPIEGLLRFGYTAKLNTQSKVLDLCCGYGTVLKLFSEAFGITGVGVDINQEFITKGDERLKMANLEKVHLICADVNTYKDETKYDMVICSETFDSIENTFKIGERYLKEGGTLAYHKVYAKTPNPPHALIEFEGPLLTLSELNQEFNGLGYFLAYLASDANNDWERYITWSARRDYDSLKANPEDTDLAGWIDKWYTMYFDYRRIYQGQALFGLTKK